jgi:hypothetical protein
MSAKRTAAPQTRVWLRFPASGRPAGGHVLKLPLGHAKNPTVAAEPKVPLVVFENLRNDAITQALPGVHRMKTPRLQPSQTAARRANPQCSLAFPCARPERAVLAFAERRHPAVESQRAELVGAGFPLPPPLGTREIHWAIAHSQAGHQVGPLIQRLHAQHRLQPLQDSAKQPAAKRRHPKLSRRSLHRLAAAPLAALPKRRHFCSHAFLLPV